MYHMGQLVGGDDFGMTWEPLPRPVIITHNTSPFDVPAVKQDVA